MKKLIALAILVFIVQALTVVQAQAARALQEAGTNSVSGVVFFDLDGDGFQALNEEPVAFALVHIQEVGSDVVGNMAADESGYFNTGEMAYGRYNIWTEVNGQNSVVATIEIAEIGTPVLVHLPIAHTFNVMLPFVSN